MGRIVLGTLAGAVTSFVLGFLIYGIALADFMAAHTAPNVIKDPPNLVFIALGQISLALLLTLAIDRWGGDSKSAVGGAKVGALFGLLIALGIDLTIYGTENIATLTATLVDPVINTGMVAFAGAAIGMVLGRRTT